MIIDANAHATADGKWFNTDHDASLDRLLREMDAAGVDRAVVTGIPGYLSTSEVLRVTSEHPERLIPVGAFDPSRFSSCEQAVSGARDTLRDRGIVGFKLHPRLNRYDPLEQHCLAVLDEISTWPQVPLVWICTFLHGPGIILKKPSVETLCELAVRFPAVNFVFVHGGGPDLLRLATAARSLPNTHFDLSYTMTRFAGSSVTLDLQYLFKTFDERLLFGSDFPEVGVPDATFAFSSLTQEIPQESIANISGQNLLRLIGEASQA